jgi:hypothetical protein
MEDEIHFLQKKKAELDHTDALHTLSSSNTCTRTCTCWQINFSTNNVCQGLAREIFKPPLMNSSKTKLYSALILRGCLLMNLWKVSLTFFIHIFMIMCDWSCVTYYVSLYVSVFILLSYTCTLISSSDCCTYTFISIVITLINFNLNLYSQGVDFLALLHHKHISIMYTIHVCECLHFTWWIS